MKPRRLQRLTIFSMSGVSLGEAEDIEEWRSGVWNQRLADSRRPAATTDRRSTVAGQRPEGRTMADIPE